jgi:hypothetical protein
MWRPMEALMSFRRFALLIPLFAAPLAARETVGTFATWAAFCDEPSKCFAISMPAERLGHPFLSVAIQRSAPIVQAHLGRPARAASVAIGDLKYDLAVDGADAHADARTSRRIVAAMRGGEALTVIATSARGGRFRHHYLLAGAPSAIDAATIAAMR